MDILSLFSSYDQSNKEIMMSLMEELTPFAKSTYGFGVQAKQELESYEDAHIRLNLPDVKSLFQLLIYRCFVFHGYGELREGGFIPIEGVNGCENLFPIYTQLLKMIGLIDPSHDVITREEFFADFVIPPDTSIKSIGYNFWMLAHFFMNNMGFNPQQYPQIFKYFNSLETRVEREIEKEKQFFRELESILPQIRDTNDDMVILLNSPNPVEVLSQVLLTLTPEQLAAMSPSVKEYFGIPQSFGTGMALIDEGDPLPLTPDLSSTSALYREMFQLLRTIHNNPDMPVTQEHMLFANNYKAAFVNALQVFTSDVRSKTPLPIIQRLNIAEILGFNVQEIIPHLVLTQQEIQEIESFNQQATPPEAQPDLPDNIHPDYFDAMFGMNPKRKTHRRKTRKRKSRKKKSKKSRKSRKKK